MAAAATAAELGGRILALLQALPLLQETAGLLCGLLAIAAALPLPAGAESLQQNAARLFGRCAHPTAGRRLGFAELWQMAKDYLAANIGEPLAFGLRAAGYLLVAGVLGLLAGANNWRRCIDAVAVLGFAAMSLAAGIDLVRTAGDTAQDCQNYLIAFVPVYSGIAAAGGQTAGGTGLQWYVLRHGAVFGSGHRQTAFAGAGNLLLLCGLCLRLGQPRGGGSRRPFLQVPALAVKGLRRGVQLCAGPAKRAGWHGGFRRPAHRQKCLAGRSAGGGGCRRCGPDRRGRRRAAAQKARWP